MDFHQHAVILSANEGVMIDEDLWIIWLTAMTWRSLTKNLAEVKPETSSILDSKCYDSAGPTVLNTEPSPPSHRKEMLKGRFHVCYISPEAAAGSLLYNYMIYRDTEIISLWGWRHPVDTTTYYSVRAPPPNRNLSWDIFHCVFNGVRRLPCLSQTDRQSTPGPSLKEKRRVVNLKGEKNRWTITQLSLHLSYCATYWPQAYRTTIQLLFKQSTGRETHSYHWLWHRWKTQLNDVWNIWPTGANTAGHTATNRDTHRSDQTLSQNWL